MDVEKLIFSVEKTRNKYHTMNDKQYL